MKLRQGLVIWTALFGASLAQGQELPEGPSFNCRLARSEAEKIICSSPALQQADRRMAEAYRAALAELDIDAQTQLIGEQRAWVRERDAGVASRTPLAKEDWLEVAIGDRTAELLTAKERFDKRTIPPETAQSICSKVLRLTNAGRIPASELPHREPTDHEASEFALERGASLKAIHEFEGGRGRRPRLFAAVVGGGSCHPYDIVDYDAARQGLAAYYESRPDYGLSGYEDQYLLSIDGEPVVVEGGFSRWSTDGRIVSWFGRRHSRPLCTLVPDGTVRVSVRRADNPTLCQRVAEGKVKPLPWGPVQGKGAYKFNGKPPKQGDLEAVASVGAGAKIGLWIHESGAGCGSTEVYLVGIAGPSVPDMGLAALSEDEWTPLARGVAYRDAVKLFSIEGSTYVLGNTQRGVGLFPLNDRKRAVCEFDYLPQMMIETKYF